MSNVKWWVITPVAIVIMGVLWTGSAFTQSGAAGSGLMLGTVTAADGSPMEGVVVSARTSDETWTTSVYTDSQGRYSFPPLGAGEYSMWAQAKGYDIARAEFSLADDKRVDRDLTMRSLADSEVVTRQLDGPEWFAALPEGNDQERRMKHLLRNNCTACHGAAVTLQARFDERGWANIIDVMARGIPPVRDPGAGNPTWQAYKDELAQYLGRVSEDLLPTPGPRPVGAATQVVITEYDIPRQGRPISAHTGTFWTEGISTRYESKGARDIWVDSQGNLWVSDDRSMGRTTGRLDPRTGLWTDYAMPDEQGVATRSHGIWGDRETDTVFQGGQPDGAILMFDTKTEEFVHFAPPDSIPGAGGHIDVDSQGNAWAPSRNGALKLDPKTGEYTYYPVPYLEGSRPSDQNQYGLAVDSQDNVWLARAGTESVAWLDTKSGETGHIKFEPIAFTGLTEKDRTVAVGMNNGPPNGKGAPQARLGRSQWRQLHVGSAEQVRRGGEDRYSHQTGGRGVCVARGKRALFRDRRQERHGLDSGAECRPHLQARPHHRTADGVPVADPRHRPPASHH